jgi:outer membrane lipoprotein-sorting protein
MRVLTAVLFLASLAIAEEATSPPKKDASAEELLKKVEQKYSKAKTIQYKVAYVAKEGSDEVKVSYQIRAKAGNRFWLSMSGVTREKSQLDFTCTCDGTALLVTVNGKQQNAETVSNGAEALLRAAVVRVGIGFSTRTFMSKEAQDSACDKFVVSEVEQCADEKIAERQAKVLVYTVRITGTEFVLKEKIWIDAENLALIKREIKDASKDAKNQFEEVYTEQHFDEEIADEKFQLPEKK